ncbi:MAG TPA: dienelactone hydrolase family protein [Bryobacteraceae bacterium]|jgi:dienelactone hydrolase|nr:dienelactone hydrolase family protein [Bryobacteraceae bacterium]
MKTFHILQRAIHIPIPHATLEGDLTIPHAAAGIIVFAHGSGSSRRSPRNRYVAGELHEAGLATLLFDLLTRAEEEMDARTAHLRFDVGLLSARLEAATDWLQTQKDTRDLLAGYFGASTGAAAALIAAARRPHDVYAVVSRGGRPDLAREWLPMVQAPTLLIVGGDDLEVIRLNQLAFNQLRVEQKRLELIPGASHLFEEPGALEQVAALARDWFRERLRELRTI